MSVTTPVGYWKMDAASGNESDSVGSRTFVVTTNGGGTIASTTGILNGGRTIARTTGDRWVNGSPLTSLPLSYNIWFKTTTNSTQQNIIGAGISGSNNFAHGVALLSTGKLDFFASNGSASFNDIIGGTTVTANAWHMLTLVWRSDTDREIYLDGVSEAGGSGQTSKTVDAAMNNFVIGFYAGGSGGDGFDGPVDEVGLWDVALSGSEITQLYNSGAALALEDFGGGGPTGNPWNYYAQAG